MGTSIIRTVTAYLVGWLLSFSVVQAIGLTSEQLTWLVLVVLTGLSTLLGSVYYAALRLLEQRWPWLGWLLGRKGAPVYVARHEAGDAR